MRCASAAATTPPMRWPRWRWRRRSAARWRRCCTACATTAASRTGWNPSPRSTASTPSTTARAPTSAPPWPRWTASAPTAPGKLRRHPRAATARARTSARWLAPVARHARAVAPIGRDAARIEAALADEPACRLPRTTRACSRRRRAWCFEQAQRRRRRAAVARPAPASTCSATMSTAREVFVAAVQATRGRTRESARMTADRARARAGNPIDALRGWWHGVRIRRGTVLPTRRCRCASGSHGARRRRRARGAAAVVRPRAGRWSSARLLALGAGDGLFAPRSRCPTTRKFAALRADAFPGAPCRCRWRSRFVAALLARAGAGGGLGEATRPGSSSSSLLLLVAGAGALRRPERQRRAALDPAGHHELPALRARQAGDRAVCRRATWCGKMDVKENFFRAVTPMAVAVAVVGLLLLAEPDMGAFMVIATIAMGILFLGGVNGRMFLLITGVLLGAFALMIAPRAHGGASASSPTSTRGTRSTRWARRYQLSHSLIAFGRGEIFGQGLGSSVEKLHYLPEAHTDFLLAVIGEELGFVGVRLRHRRLLLADAPHLPHRPPGGRARPRLRRPVAQGIGIWMGGQAFINMGVNLGVLPTKGLTLPLMSYGGSAILINLVALAIVLRSRHREPNAHARRPRMSPRHLVVVAAGTGGHVIPGLAVAREMLAARLERQLARHDRTAWRTGWCRRAGSRSTRVAFSGLRGKGLLHSARRRAAAARAPSGTCLSASCAAAAPTRCSAWAATCAFPGGMMASLLRQAAGAGQCRCRAAAQQQGAAAGGRPRRLRLRRRGARGARSGAVVTGNPVRAEIEAHRRRRPSASPARSGPLRLLVVGGSLGAAGAQRRVPAALALMPAHRRARGDAPDRRRRTSTPSRAAYAERGRRGRGRCPSSTTWRRASRPAT